MNVSSTGEFFLQHSPHISSHFKSLLSQLAQSKKTSSKNHVFHHQDDITVLRLRNPEYEHHLTVHGRNPAPVDMVNIPLFTKVLYIPGGCFGFLHPFPL